jgi:uncharacterized membrane protein
MRRLPAPWQIASLLFAVAGIGVSGYLVRVHYDDALLVCGIGDCHTVQQSKYAEIFGIPIAILGLGMYLTVLGLGIARWRKSEWHLVATTAVFAIALAGVLYSAYLTYVEIWVIDAICQWCVASACLTLGILLVEGFGLYGALGVPADFDDGEDAGTEGFDPRSAPAPRSR